MVSSDVTSGRYSPTLRIPAVVVDVGTQARPRTLLSAPSRHISQHGVGEDVRQGLHKVILVHLYTLWCRVVSKVVREKKKKKWRAEGDKGTRDTWSRLDCRYNSVAGGEGQYW